MEWMVKRIILVIFDPFSEKEIKNFAFVEKGKIFKWFLWISRRIWIDVLLVYFRALNTKSVRFMVFN